MNSVTLEDGHLVIETPYDAELVARIKQLPQRRWDPVKKVWLVNTKYAEDVEKIAATFSIEYKAPTADILNDTELFEPEAAVKITYETYWFSLWFEYDLRLLDKVRAIPRARYSAIMRCWTAPLESALEVLEFAQDTGAVVDETCGEPFQEAQKMYEKVAASRATTSDLEVEGLRGELMPFQRAGVEYAINAKRCFIADEMGLGKTVQALASIHKLNAYPAVIVCPASLKINWQREALKWLPKGKKVEVLRGRKGNVPKADIVIVNYDILEYWAPLLNGFESVVFDESHYCKNPKAKRTKAAIALADKIEEPIFCLTGTPVLNNPSELTAQLRILGRLKEFGGAMKFRDAYASTKHLPELNRRLRASMYVRRRKVDVLTELPPKRWSDVVVEPSADHMKKYREAEEDLISFLAGQAKKSAEAQGATTHEAREAALIATMKAQAAEQLVAVNTLKRLASEAKYSLAVEWMDNFLTSESKLIVFTWHKDLANRITEHYGAVKLTGDSSMEERTKAVDSFQNDPEVKVFVSTLKAGGVGITLTAASDVLFLEQGWTPADMDQAADRAHRIGQQDSVTAWTLIAQDTIDEDIKELIAYKRELVDASTDGKVLEDKQNVLTDLLIRLARKGIDVSN
jgi:SWI/SNF-related matrix-associated actin-dependent regulator of chromatin subfamily A-like protein 1